MPGGLDVGELLTELGVDRDTLVAGLLSPPELEADAPADGLGAAYGETVARLARNARWLNAFREHAPDAGEREPAERLRRMILALAEDVRAVLIRLAYRTARLRLSHAEPREERRRLARETLDLYAPLAHRLGISRLKWELEDLAFRYLEPEVYKRIADGLAARRADRERFIETFTDDLREALVADGITDFEVFGRPKHIYSIWRKMQRKDLEQDELFDVEAVRVLVERVQECYTALGAVHARWPHIPKEFDDYIANPKDNGYQSLHTAIVGPSGRPVEVQIRTREMNEHAERGVAAHWLYKEGSAQGRRLQQSVNALRSLLESGADDGLSETFGRELFADRVFVFTPRGDVVDLPQGATALDFAFAIHTDVGYRCRGAKVNGQIVPLTHTLRNGEHVEVLTTREPRPSRDWLNRDLGYLRTSRARAKVRAWFNQQDHRQHVDEGRALLERELRRLNARDLPLERLAREAGFERQRDLFAALGRNDLSSARIAAAVQALTRPRDERAPATAPARRDADGDTGDALRVRGMGNLLTRVAECCRPVPGDEVIGFITRGRGVTVHRRDCHNILRLGEDERERLIEVEWGDGDSRQRWGVDLDVDAFDRPGLLRDVMNVLAEEDVDVVSAELRETDEPPHVRVHVSVRIRDMAQLDRALQRVGQLPNVLDATRAR
ncbi:MAG: bifunctional (p)ppGpp synthetase/guanosine-3',5'-bis(diphosphate) 3'-pyrophosphohydrolase [Halofilum sp. (in: g-proteobacteria)]|nr:bifunctional (p)ppGpp synthetase/guanosine-3',5'-bis(diphosphate) 3'-pyrophosphohydrolase [Halofilum sp. (in: g-proteobacteria)]